MDYFEHFYGVLVMYDLIDTMLELSNVMVSL